MESAKRSFALIFNNLSMWLRKSHVSAFYYKLPAAGSLSGVEGAVPQLEAEIDRLVYELYGLTEEEITVVEGKK
jgi:hypothetical protein